MKRFPLEHRKKEQDYFPVKPGIVFLFSAVSLIILAIGLPITVGATLSTLFSDGFSATSPLSDGWTSECVEGCDGIADSDIFTLNNANLAHDGYFMVTRDDRAAIRSIETTGFENIELSYYRRTYLANSGDEIVVEWRVGNSGDWLKIEQSAKTNTWTLKTFQFPSSANDESEIQIRFWLDDGNFDYALWDDINVSGEEIIEEIPLSIISGYKFEDFDGDGSLDEGDLFLDGWTILLLDGEEVIDTVETGDGEWADGYYEFTDLEDGDYIVCELLQDNWIETYPEEATDDAIACEEEGLAPWGHALSVSGSDFADINFGNFEEGNISGHKFDSEEEPVEDWKIYAIYPDGSLHFRTTNEIGYYNFSDLGPGTYQVCEKTEDEEGGDVCLIHPQQLSPEGEFYVIEMTSGAEGLDNPDYDFENELVNTIRAFKYFDQNGNGEQDEEEPPIADWEICLYIDDDEEPELISCELTDEEGLIEWTDLESDNYILDEEERENWFPTTADEDGSIFFDLDTGEITIEFGNTQNTIHAFKYLDINSNGQRDEGELPLEDWEICLYFDDEELELVSCEITDEEGLVWWMDLESGDYLVIEEIRKNWFPTNTEDGEIFVELELGEQMVEFGNNTISIHAFKYFDQNGNGEQDEGELPLEDWEICLYFDDEELELVSCELTDEEGLVWWMGLTPGIYLVEEEEKEGWFNTTENPVLVEIEGGDTLVEFGNTTQSIHAHKFFDIDKDGEWSWEEDDPIESSIRNWGICLFDALLYDEEGPNAEPIDCQSTDEDGWVWWMNLLPGNYKVVEESRENWASTTNDIYSVELEPGDESEFHFGNWIEDEISPQSLFEDEFDHEVIDTEIVSLSLTGSSQDFESGVDQAELVINKIGDEDSVADFPASSFFDVFFEIECSAEVEPIETEIVALSLVSTDPITVTWGHDWTPSGLGIYCLETRATDYAGNVEETVYAGPIAYVPVAEISDEATEAPSENSFTATWNTDKPATSRVIYDTVSHSELGEVPNYGYAFSTDEEDLDPKVTSHSVTVGGLNSGTTYFYRVISKSSPESVGGEQSTETSSGGGGGGVSPTVFLSGFGGGGGGGGSSSPTPAPTSPAPTPPPAPVTEPEEDFVQPSPITQEVVEEEEDEPIEIALETEEEPLSASNEEESLPPTTDEEQLAAVSSAFPGYLTTLIGLLLAVIAGVIWYAYRRQQLKKSK